MVRGHGGPPDGVAGGRRALPQFHRLVGAHGPDAVGVGSPAAVGPCDSGPRGRGLRRLHRRGGRADAEADNGGRQTEPGDLLRAKSCHLHSNAVFRTDLDFTVTAWVRLNASDSWGTMLSVHHGDFGVFLLSYDSDKDRWAVLVPNQATGWADGDQTVFSRERPEAGAWTHLAAVYDLRTRQLRLYVNGELSATRSCRRLVRATGPLKIGRALEQGRPIDH
ncbi:LamG domain-containing protein [Actinomadura luteofluorescens]|uniref:LamG domain-containing protein n=1 Tax=Actinomadura luteofluorescens TaxID=46163 RepID=UPI003D8FED8A